MFKALDEVKGDLSNNNKAFREALNKTDLDSPNGNITLDENRQAIGTNFVTEVVKDEKGDLDQQGGESHSERARTSRLLQGGVR